MVAAIIRGSATTPFLTQLVQSSAPALGGLPAFTPLPGPPAEPSCWFSLRLVFGARRDVSARAERRLSDDGNPRQKRGAADAAQDSLRPSPNPCIGPNPQASMKVDSRRSVKGSRVPRPSALDSPAPACSAPPIEVMGQGGHAARHPKIKWPPRCYEHRGGLYRRNGTSIDVQDCILYTPEIGRSVRLLALSSL